MNGNDLTNLIEDYYNSRNLKFPDFHQSMLFVMTEIGEVGELILARENGWVRNNPETKPKFSKEELGKELGDAIMMLIVAGMAEGVDPLKSLEEKIKEKMGGYNKGVNIYPDKLKATKFITELGELKDIEEEKDGD